VKWGWAPGPVGPGPLIEDGPFPGMRKKGRLGPFLRGPDESPGAGMAGGGGAGVCCLFFWPGGEEGRGVIFTGKVLAFPMVCGTAVDFYTGPRLDGLYGSSGNIPDEFLRVHRASSDFRAAVELVDLCWTTGRQRAIRPRDQTVKKRTAATIPKENRSWLDSFSAAARMLGLKSTAGAGISGPNLYRSDGEASVDLLGDICSAIRVLPRPCTCVVCG